jgi:hypothetical protein
VANVFEDVIRRKANQKDRRSRLSAARKGDASSQRRSTILAVQV